MRITRYILMTGMFCLWLTGAGTDLLASESRVASMGGVGLFLYDNSNVPVFPAALMRYNNQLRLELRLKGQENTFSGLIHLPLGDRAVGGLVLNRPLPLPLPDLSFGHTSIDDVTDVLFAYRTGGTVVGVRVSGAYSRRQRTVPDTTVVDFDDNLYFVEFAAGISGDRYDLGVSANLAQLSGTTGGENQKWDGTGFGGAARFFFGEPGSIQYVPVVFAESFSSSGEDMLSKIKSDRITVGVALGLHYQVDEKNLIVVGIEPFRYQQVVVDPEGVQKTTNRLTNLPAFMVGGETRPFRWLFVRLGGRYVQQDARQEVVDTNGERTELVSRTSTFNAFAGVGLQVGKFLLDLDINENFLFEGPDFISGGDRTTGDIVHRVSMTYAF
ncbi:MAG: hypothetical protein D6681_01680 [Calditrichaeota bacterium]|nr:MAG: hypothetical protein D6681_01680 [Calditrichota bacterium]